MSDKDKSYSGELKYSISEFSHMVSMPYSKIRFFDKYGVFRCQRDTNGYRCFTVQDAFRANAFRTLRGYGFSIEKAVELLDQKQDCPEFITSLQAHLISIESKIELLTHQRNLLLTTMTFLDGDNKDKFRIVNQEDILFVRASIGMDFSISRKNVAMLEVFSNLIPITSFARLIPIERFAQDSDIVLPDYVNALPISRKACLGSDYDKKQVEGISLGKSVYYKRQKTRDESLQKSSFDDLFIYLKKNNLEINGDLILFPSFLNLEGTGQDIERLYIPIK